MLIKCHILDHSIFVNCYDQRKDRQIHCAKENFHCLRRQCELNKIGRKLSLLPLLCWWQKHNCYTKVQSFSNFRFHFFSLSLSFSQLLYSISSRHANCFAHHIAALSWIFSYYSFYLSLFFSHILVSAVFAIQSTMWLNWYVQVFI